jgi:hypothetical protein
MEIAVYFFHGFIFILMVWFVQVKSDKNHFNYSTDAIKFIGNYKEQAVNGTITFLLLGTIIISFIFCVEYFLYWFDVEL